jgi:hypothetical protein
MAYRRKELYGGRAGEKEVDDIKPVVEFSTMPQEMRDVCISKVKEAMRPNVDSNISYYQTLAKKIKTELETDKNETWNVIVGSEFGAYIAFEKAYVLWLRMNEVYFLIFRFGAGQNK